MKTPTDKPPRYLTLTISPEENLLERTALVEKIFALFQPEDCRWIVIHGESGLGKTTLANALFHAADKRNSYGQFGWIPFATNLPKSIVKAVSNWEPQGNQPKNEAFYTQAAREEVLQLRNYETPQLIVLDGVESEEAILKHLDLLEIRSAKFLITTRQPFHDPRFLNFRILPLEDGDVLHFFSKAGLQVDLLTQEELKAVRGNPWLLQLLTSNIPKFSERAAKDFIRQIFASMPAEEDLALSVAQGIFNTASLSAASCWVLLQFAALPSGQYDADTFASYLIDLDTMDTATELADEANEETGKADLEIDWLNGYHLFAEDWPHTIDQENVQLSELLLDLSHRGWLSNLNSAFSIHDNTIQILKNEGWNDATYFPELCDCFSINYFTAQHKYLKDNLQYESHLLSWLDFVEAEGTDAYLNTLKKLITFYKDIVDYNLELFFRLQYLDLAESSQSEDVIIDLKVDLAENYKRLGQYDSASECAQKALESAIRLFGNLHPIVEKCQNELGTILEYLGEYARARDLLEASLASALIIWGSEHRIVATRQSNLGNIYRNLGEYARARALLEAALASDLKNFGAEHPHVAIRQSNLSNVCQNLGEYTFACDLLEAALASDLKNFGAEHPNIAIRQSNLGNVYRNLGEYSRARDLLETALASDLKNFGAEHPNIAIRQSNLSIVYQNLGEYTRARDLLEAALTSDLKNLGAEHPYVAIRQINLGNVYRDLGEYTHARDLLEAALVSDLKSLGPKHPFIAVHQSNLGNVYRDLGEYDRARDLLEAALASDLKNFGPEHPNIAILQSHLGNVYRDLGEYTRARDLLEAATASDLKNFGPEHPKIADHQLRLGAVFLNIEEKAKAKELFKQAYQLRQKLLGEQHPKTQTAKDLLDSVED